MHPLCSRSRTDVFRRAVLLVHALVSLAVAISTPGAALYLFVLLLGTLGFVAYGLFLLRDQRARADGGPDLLGALGTQKEGGPPQ